MGIPNMTKYAGLTDYLRARTDDELILTFDEIADIIDGYLPKSAELQQYWEDAANMRAGHKASRKAGYKPYLIRGHDKVHFIRAN
jgi:hypothetical protein